MSQVHTQVHRVPIQDALDMNIGDGMNLRWHLVDIAEGAFGLDPEEEGEITVTVDGDDFVATYVPAEATTKET